MISTRKLPAAVGAAAVLWAAAAAAAAQVPPNASPAAQAAPASSSRGGPAPAPRPAATAAPAKAPGAAAPQTPAAKGAVAAQAAKGTAPAQAAPKKGQPAATPAQGAAAEKGASPAKGTPPAAPTPAGRLAPLRQSAVDAYVARNWAGAAAAADAYNAEFDASGLPRAGVDWALVQFIGGHAKFELWKASKDTFKYDFDREVLGAMEASLRIVQDDLFFKHNVLGSAYFERLKATGFKQAGLEDAASWHLLRALLARGEELRSKPETPEERTAFAKYALQYIGRAFEMARHSAAPDVYLVRVREACRLGFGSPYDDRFAQLHQVVGFDGGNVLAGVLWQTGLDEMNTEGSKPDDVLDTFRQAAKATRGPKERAEILRQMSDYASRQDEFDYKLKAVEYGRQAFALDPSNKDVQAQYGTSLHVVSYANFSSGKFQQALEYAKEATGFAWDGDEVAYFDLSRAQANFGDKIAALTNAETAYDKARRKYAPAEAAPFRQNFVAVLRQFGLAQRAAQVEAEDQGGRP